MNLRIFLMIFVLIYSFFINLGSVFANETLPQYVSDVISKTNSYYTDSEKNYEIKKDWIDYKVWFNQSCLFLWKGYDSWIQKQGVVIKFNSDYCYFTLDTLEKKIYFSEISHLTYEVDDITKIFLNVWWNLYHISLTNYYLNPFNDWLYVSYIQMIKKENKVTILFDKKTKKYIYVTTGKIYNLWNIEQYTNATWLNNENTIDILKLLMEDKMLEKDSSEIISTIKYLKWEFNWKFWNTQESVLSNTYEYIKWNIKYDTTVLWKINTEWFVNNPDIHNWYLSYKNKLGVCDGMTKILRYSLYFNGYYSKDIEQEFWFVSNSREFPTSWHSWLRVWDKYYDITFDLYNKDNFYFWINKETLYIDRFGFNDIISFEKYKNLSLEDRIKEVDKIRYDLSVKYTNEGKDIPLLLSFDSWKYKKGLWDSITPDEIPKVFKESDIIINNGWYYLSKNGNIVSKLQFFNLTKENESNLTYWIKSMVFYNKIDDYYYWNIPEIKNKVIFTIK